jgi:hypothetical protein
MVAKTAAIIGMGQEGEEELTAKAPRRKGMRMGDLWLFVIGYWERGRVHLGGNEKSDSSFYSLITSNE